MIANKSSEPTGQEMRYKSTFSRIHYRSTKQRKRTSSVMATEQAEREEEMMEGENWPFVPAVNPTVTMYVKMAISGM